MNHATRVTAATLGVIFGMSGMSHGFFETLQGNMPTDGMFISRYGARLMLGGVVATADLPDMNLRAFDEHTFHVCSKCVALCPYGEGPFSKSD